MSNTELPQGTEKAISVRRMFDTIAPRYDTVNKLITFGLDVIWRRRSMHHLGLPDNSLVFDIACGTGDYCRMLSRAGHRPIGVDLSYGMLAAARTSAPLLQADATRLPLADRSVDGITSGFALRNFVDLDALFAETARVLRPGGRMVMLDAYEPSNKVLRAGHGFYFSRVVPRVGALLSDGPAYSYLPRSLSYLPPVDEMLESIRAAGFRSVQRHTFSGGIVHMFTATRD